MPMANVNGINISYRVEGQGEPLIMISGSYADKSAWRYQTRNITARSRLITGVLGSLTSPLFPTPPK